MYQCRLKIDGRLKKLSLRDGINLKDLSELLAKLANCLEAEAVNFTLVEIKEQSYTPTIETESLLGVEKFNEIHQTIKGVSYKDLPQAYKEYATTLNTILFERGLYIQAQNSKDDISIEVTSIELEDKTPVFYSVTTIKGKIVSIVGRNESKPYITFQVTPNKSYKIFINREQEGKLGPFYKEDNLRLRVRLKVNSESLEKTEGSLIDFTAPDNIGFLEAIKRAKEEFGDIFININDSAKQLKELRNL